MPVFFLATARTPIGAFGGSLRGMATTELAARAMAETLRRGDLDPARVQEAVLGCAFPAGCGENPARRAAQEAGIHCPAFTVSMGAGSGLKSVILAAQGLAAGSREFALAGGADNASRAPYLVPEGRWGTRMGQTDILDSLLVDGSFAFPETTVPEDAIPSPATQSRWAGASRLSARESRTARQRELFPLSWAGKRGLVCLSEDEDPAQARLPFWENFATPADGAAILLLGTSRPPQPLGRLLGVMETALGWQATIRKLLASLGLSVEAVDRWELQEASAAHILGLLNEMPDLDPARVNVRGGALALGDAGGANGARMLISLLNTLQDEGLETGVVATPAGQGLTLAMAITRS